MPGISAWSFSRRCRSCSGSGIDTVERDEVEAPPDALNSAHDRGLMIAAQQELMRRRKIEELSVQEPTRERISAGQVLYAGLVEPGVLAGFVHQDGAHAL
jgi:hypothetical protein